jgi:hypothetical protein
MPSIFAVVLFGSLPISRQLRQRQWPSLFIISLSIYSLCGSTCSPTLPSGGWEGGPKSDDIKKAWYSSSSSFHAIRPKSIREKYSVVFVVPILGSVATEIKYKFVEEAGEGSGMGLCLIKGHLLNIRSQKSKMSN